MVPIRTKLENGAVTVGTFLAIGSAHSAEIIGQAGFDWVILDTQHGGFSEPQLLPMLQALDLKATPALVRVNWLDPAQIMRAADLGAAGVVVPMVNTPEDAARAVAAIRYPPHGMRSFGPVRTYYAQDGTSEEPLCLVMIETVEALENLAEIAVTPGLDGLLVGPVDLALSMGRGLSLEMPASVLDAIERVAAVCREHGLIAASVALGHANAKEQLKRGIRFLSSGADSLFMRRAAAEELAVLRGLVGKVGEP
jgi:4-hydroxy-2-oxoheptanedioate aldolase